MVSNNILPVFGLVAIIAACAIIYPGMDPNIYLNAGSNIYDAGHDHTILLVGSDSYMADFLERYGDVTFAEWDDVKKFNRTDYEIYDTLVIFENYAENIDAKSASILLSYGRRDKNLLWIGIAPNMEFIAHTRGEMFIEDGIAVQNVNLRKAKTVNETISVPVKNIKMNIISTNPNSPRTLVKINSQGKDYAAVQSCPAGKNLIYASYDISETPEIADLIFSIFEP